MAKKWWFWVCLMIMVCTVMAGLNNAVNTLVSGVVVSSSSGALEQENSVLKDRNASLQEELETLKNQPVKTITEEKIVEVEKEVIIEKPIDPFETPTVDEQGYAPYSVEELVKDYNDNDVRAKRVHMNERVKISGTIGNFAEDGSLPYFSFHCKDSWFYKIKCLPSNSFNENQLLSLNEEDKVVVYGTITDVGGIEVYEVKIDSVVRR